MKNRNIIIILAAIMIAMMPSCQKTGGIKTLIVTGQSDHSWMVSSEAIKQILDETGLFSTRVLISPAKGEDISRFNPKFAKYDLVVIDYEGDMWPEQTITSLNTFIGNGGGVVLFNARNYPDIFKSDSISVTDRQNFEIRTQITDHPVTKGLPARWFHPGDIIVRGLKVSGEDVMVLAGAVPGGQFSRGRKPEPILLAKNSGEGRIFATMLGTPDDGENEALHCTGFIVTLQRGAEWAATGSVTQEVPFDFPTAAGAVTRADFTGVDFDEAFESLGSYDIQKSTLYFTWLQSQVRKAAGDPVVLLNLEKKMVEVLRNTASTVEAKKLILKELSWMGTDYCIPAIKELSAVEELKDNIDFALTRLQL
jgi:hypothetical protein